MGFTNSSLAAGIGAGAANVPAGKSGQDVPRNIVLVGTYLSSISGINDETVYGPYTNDTQVGIVFGFGSMLHRLALATFNTRPTATVWCIPQAETVGAGAATSTTIAITGPATAAGTLAIYIDKIGSQGVYQVPVASGEANTAIADALAALINADSKAPVTATSALGDVSLTAKSAGPWGNAIPIGINLVAGDAMPAGIGVTITALSGGTGVPTIANALTALGTGSASNVLPNGQQMTALVHGYLGSATTMTATAQDQTTLSAISTYNGPASTNPTTPPTGCYDHLVARPFRCVNADVTLSASVPAALISLSGANTLDRTDGLICRPGSNTHPCEIAAIATAAMESVTAVVAAQMYVGVALIGVEPGPTGQWTEDYTNRDTAVKAGISPTVIEGGTVFLQNVVTFYTANTSVPSVSNGYREFRNLAILGNIVADLKSTFAGPKWQGITIVSDVSNVTDPAAKLTVRSVNDVIDELINRTLYYAGKAWLYDPQPVIDQLLAGGLVTVRPAGDGFVNILPAILSGMANIIDTTLQFDTSIAA